MYYPPSALLTNIRTVGERSIEHVISFPIKYISKDAIDMILSLDIGNNPST